MFGAEYGSPRSNIGTARQTAIQTVKSEGYDPISIDGFRSEGGLNLIIAQNSQAADSAVQAFFFLGSRYLGTATEKPTPDVTLAYSTGSTVALNYGLFRPSDAQCCPSDGAATVRFHWSGTELVPLDPIPATSYNANPSMR